MIYDISKSLYEKITEDYNYMNDIYINYYKNNGVYYNNNYYLEFINNKSIEYLELYSNIILKSYFKYIKLLLIYYNINLKSIIKSSDIDIFFHVYFEDMLFNNYYDNLKYILLNINFFKIMVENLDFFY